MTKKIFVESILAIKKQREKDEKFSRFMENYLDGHFVSTFSYISCLALEKLLIHSMNDKDGWIEWWIYEKDFGKNLDIKAYNKDQTEIILDTAEQLYTFLNENTNNN